MWQTSIFQFILQPEEGSKGHPRSLPSLIRIMQGVWVEQTLCA